MNKQEWCLRASMETFCGVNEVLTGFLVLGLLMITKSMGTGTSAAIAISMRMSMVPGGARMARER